MEGNTHIIVCLVLVFYTTACHSSLAKRNEHELTSVEECNIPKEEYEPVPIKYALRIDEAKNPKTVDLNLTVAKKTLPLLTTFRVYNVVENKKIEHHVVANLSCKHPVISFVWKQLRFRYDKNCCMLSGITVINHINLEEQFFHNPRIFAAIPAGAHIYDFQLHTKKGVMLCLTTRID